MLLPPMYGESLQAYGSHRPKQGDIEDPSREGCKESSDASFK